MTVPNLSQRLSAVLGRTIEPHERQSDILVELLERLEQLTEGDR